MEMGRWARWLRNEKKFVADEFTRWLGHLTAPGDRWWLMSSEIRRIIADRAPKLPIKWLCRGRRGVGVHNHVTRKKTPSAEKMFTCDVSERALRAASLVLPVTESQFRPHHEPPCKQHLHSHNRRPARTSMSLLILLLAR